MTEKRAEFTAKAPIHLMDAPRRAMPPAFHVMLKPRGAICNLDCSYCFYLRKEHMFDDGAPFRMPDHVLESFTRQYIQAQSAPEVTFAWQGGEPTMMGLDFFRRALHLQKKYQTPGMIIHNSFQTNGTLLDGEWARFLKENGFLVGLSMDGPEHLHDDNRVDKGGRPTFQKVYSALKLLQRWGVEHNVLCVVNRTNSRAPLDVYRFFRGEGVQFVQFIPAVERLSEGGVSGWTPEAQDWGSFLCGVFDEWVRSGVGRVFVQHFDIALAAWLGQEPGLCVHARTCGNALAMEHTGDLFSCDHFVRGDYFLGNITQIPMADMVASPFQRRFGQDKWDALPGYCRSCPVLFACNGGCPKGRFINTPDGESGLNYLCAGYKRFFTHIDPYMRLMRALLERGEAPATIMDILRGSVPPGGPGRNDPCLCGSGRKFKQCCLGRRR